MNQFSDQPQHFRGGLQSYESKPDRLLLLCEIKINLGTLEGFVLGADDWHQHKALAF